MPRRALAPRELAKLSVASAERRIYSAVGVLDDGSLAVIGLAREGVNSGPDPFVKIVTSRPGCLEIRSGRELVIEYERGAILAVTDDPVFAAESSIHRALKAIACDSGVEEHVVPHYLDAVAFLVREMIAHGRGGILIIGTEEEPVVTGTAPYAMVLDSSLASLLRLAWRIGSDRRPPHPRPVRGVRATRAREASAPPAGAAFGQLLRSAFLTEASALAKSSAASRRSTAPYPQLQSRVNGVRHHPAGRQCGAARRTLRQRRLSATMDGLRQPRHAPSRRSDLRGGAPWQRRVRGLGGRSGILPAA